MNNYDDYEDDMVDLDALVDWVESTETVRDEPYGEDLYSNLNDYLKD